VNVPQCLMLTDPTTGTSPNTKSSVWIHVHGLGRWSTLKDAFGLAGVPSDFGKSQSGSALIRAGGVTEWQALELAFHRNKQWKREKAKRKGNVKVAEWCRVERRPVY
jgi:hypothetical protein